MVIKLNLFVLFVKKTREQLKAQTKRQVAVKNKISDALSKLVVFRQSWTDRKLPYCSYIISCQ